LLACPHPAARPAAPGSRARAAGRVLAKGAKAIVGARSPAEAAAIAGYRPLAPDVAAAVEAAARAFGE
jgi:hypothetical protein